MRFTAIVMMVVFHFIFDLRFFGYISVDLATGVFWRGWRALIVSLFLLAVGISLVLSYPGTIQLKKLGARVLVLSGAAGIVTVVSIVATPERWIYFGVLHFIAIAIILTIWLRQSPRLCLSIAVLLQLTYWLFTFPYNWPFNYLGDVLPNHTNDLVSPLPWLSMPLFGIWIAHQRSFKADPLQRVAIPKVVSWCSKQSLLIYLIHQPILFSLFYLMLLGNTV